jgi:hypothetical protein
MAAVYEQYFEMFTKEGFDGEMISLFKGTSFSDVSQRLETVGMAQPLHRERVVNEFYKLFDPQTNAIHASVRGRFFTLRCTAVTCFLLLFTLSFTHCHRRQLKFTILFPATGKAASRATAAARCCEAAAPAGSRHISAAAAVASHSLLSKCCVGLLKLLF